MLKDKFKELSTDFKNHFIFEAQHLDQELEKDNATLESLIEALNHDLRWQRDHLTEGQNMFVGRIITKIESDAESSTKVTGVVFGVGENLLKTLQHKEQKMKSLTKLFEDNDRKPILISFEGNADIVKLVGINGDTAYVVNPDDPTKATPQTASSVNWEVHVKKVPKWFWVCRDIDGDYEITLFRYATSEEAKSGAGNKVTILQKIGESIKMETP